MPNVYTQSGPLLEDELRADAKLIDRKLVRVCARWRPDWTGVRYRVYVRTTYTVKGHLLAHEEHVGTLAISATDAERKKVGERAMALVARLNDLALELELDLRGATHE